MEHSRGLRDGGAGCSFLHTDATWSTFSEASGVTGAAERRFAALFEILTCGRVEKVTDGDLYHADDRRRRRSGVDPCRRCPFKKHNSNIYVDSHVMLLKIIEV